MGESDRLGPFGLGLTALVEGGDGQGQHPVLAGRIVAGVFRRFQIGLDAALLQPDAAG